MSFFLPARGRSPKRALAAAQAPLMGKVLLKPNLNK